MARELQAGDWVTHEDLGGCEVAAVHTVDGVQVAQLHTLVPERHPDYGLASACRVVYVPGDDGMVGPELPVVPPPEGLAHYTY